MPIDLDKLKTGGALAGALAADLSKDMMILDALPMGHRLGPFRIEQELSRGGMAIVYMGARVEGDFQQRVAIKSMQARALPESASILFKRERDILAGLDHPGVARLIDGGQDAEGKLWFAMEFVDGERIDQWCARHSASPRERIERVMALCDALSHAHARLLVHRDIKPANVMISNEGQLKLLDFGIATLADQIDDQHLQVLTPAFASPEQWAGEAITTRSDVYQVGLLLATLLQVVPQSSEAMHVTRTIADEKSNPLQPRAFATSDLSALPRDLAAILNKAAQLNPNQRYSSAQELRQDLQNYLQRLPVQARNGGALYKMQRWSQRHPLALMSSVLALTALTVMTLRVVHERDIARAEAERARMSLGFLTELLNWARPDLHQGRNVTVAEALNEGVKKLDQQLLDHPQLRGELQMELGKIYVQRRDAESAVKLLEASYKALAGDPNSGTEARGQVALNLAQLYTNSAQRQESLRLLDEAMAALKPIAAQQTDFLEAWRYKAKRLLQNNDVQASIHESERAIAYAKSVKLEDDDIPVLAMINADLGLTHAFLGNRDIALRIGQESLSMLQKRLGPNHPLTGDFVLGVSNLLIQNGVYEEAQRMLEDNLVVRERLYGKRHPAYARVLNALGQVDLRTGKLEDALFKAKQAVDIANAHPGMGSLTVSDHYKLLGMVQRKMGDLTAAEQAFREALRPDRLSAATTPALGATRLELVETLILQNRIAESQSEWSAAHAEMQTLPSDHPRRAMEAELQGRIALAQNQTEAAKPLLRDALSRYRQKPPDTDRSENITHLEQLLLEQK